MSDDVLSLELLSRSECVRLLTGAQVGRVVLTAGALPAVVPVTFAVLDDAVVMCTASDTRLAAAADGGMLAFEIDEVDLPSRTGWSVVVTGVAELVMDSLTRSRIRGMVVPWAPGHLDVFIRLPLTVITGRRIVAEAAVPLPQPADSTT
ncbi:MAG TPA: pyridoxamine 5'-phosphate oxidase family protein [Actinomycetes bacterium]|jgi:nitroimidazol reductase NimA-like FMN-containing flavoprotein (pyridoxamine 5'-phosphate oxidase superfamily)|nr:pyridoxamine 5'-phosphate oxidase family protein [Actinomycetes bacterium]